MTMVDNSYFRELLEIAPSTVCKDGICTHDPEQNTYEIKIWGDTFIIAPQNNEVRCVSDRLTGVHKYFDVFVTYYLLRAKRGRIVNEWISENDLPGGSTFFRGPHLIPTHLVSDAYGNDIKTLRKKCESLGGKPLKMGDVSFSFSITSDIPVTVVYWMGDEDFPAEAKILYDRSIGDILSLDIIYALAVEVCHRLSAD